MNNEFEQSESDSNESHELNHAEQTLDDALGLWAGERMATSNHLVGQKSKAIELLKEVTHSESMPPERVSREQAPESRFSVLSISTWGWAIAATLLFAVAISWALSSRPNSQMVEAPIDILDANAITLVSTNLNQQRTLLNRFREVFGHDLESVTEVNGEVKVDLREQPRNFSRDPESSAYVSVRLVAISRETNSLGNKWAIVHDVSMLSDKENRVDIPFSKDGIEFSAWTFPVGDGLVSVDLKIKFDSPFEIVQSTSLLQKIDKPKLLFTTTLKGTEYRVYQTVNQINSSSERSGEVL